MNSKELYDSRLCELQNVSYDDLSNAFIQRGIIQCFIEVFDLSLALFRESLISDSIDMSELEVLSFTPKELIMVAYDSYVHMDETIWLDMYYERYYPDFSEPVYERASRIVKEYLPALVLLQHKLSP